MYGEHIERLLGSVINRVPVVEQGFVTQTSQTTEAVR